MQEMTRWKQSMKSTFNLERLQESQALAVLLRFSGLTLARGMIRMRGSVVACCGEWALAGSTLKQWSGDVVVLLHEMGALLLERAKQLVGRSRSRPHLHPHHNSLLPFVIALSVDRIATNQRLCM